MAANRRGRFAALALAGLLALAGEAVWTVSGGDPFGARVLVTGVVDGDTVRVGRGWRRTLVRLIGVDTPETVHPEKPVEYFGPEAAAFTRIALAGKWVRLDFEPGARLDRYGRLLAHVFLEDGTLFNRELVRLGYARTLTGFPNRYEREYLLLEAQARAERRGMWARVETGAGKIIANRRSGIYHRPGQKHYGDVAERNRVYFDTEEDAVRAGYRPARE